MVNPWLHLLQVVDTLTVDNHVTTFVECCQTSLFLLVGNEEDAEYQCYGRRYRYGCYERQFHGLAFRARDSDGGVIRCRLGYGGKSQEHLPVLLQFGCDVPPAGKVGIERAFLLQARLSLHEEVYQLFYVILHNLF